MNSVKFSYLVYNFNLNFVVEFIFTLTEPIVVGNFKAFTHMKRVLPRHH